ncbi:S-layer homology domain-containing protein [Paenibacillus sp. IB182496]|uniref:S-layer homology domain-containing protein n=1 Tax=Paenibacillus sabuli TaxID=2772509 RepID=A0A927GPL6_9BACL|nr:cadherin-like domain-containing protein [Paenibacillus sabuli]MBD2843599.1 S-layer homology domain-containing protein [Paenibacillus sabuli]
MPGDPRGNSTADLTLQGFEYETGGAPPVIQSNGGGATASVDVDENTTAVTTVFATDADGDTVTYSISGGDDQTAFAINATSGVLSFAVAPDYENPSDSNTDNSYIVVVTASDGTSSDTQTINVNVQDENEAPYLAVSAGLIVLEGGAGTIGTSALEASDEEQAAAELIYTVQAIPAHGELTSGGASLQASDTFTQADIDNGTLSYQHDGSETVSDGFAFTVSDGELTLTDQSFSITITPVNDAPHAVDDPAYSTPQDTPLVVSQAEGVLHNDTDAEADSLTAVKVSDPANGSVALDADGSFTYTPDAGFHGSDSFTYMADDGQDHSNVATATIQVVDTIAPEAPTVALSTSDWSRTDVTASVYGDPGNTLEYRVGDDPDWQLYSGPVQLNVEGQYAFAARQTDPADNVSSIAQATIRIDKTAPVIQLLGSDEMTIGLGEPFDDPGAVVTDNLASGLQAAVSGTVAPDTIGTYTLHYQASDDAGNQATEQTRLVHVVAEPVGLSFDLSDYELTIGETLPFTVLMSYSDGSALDVTDVSSYTFAPDDVATMPQAGVLQGDQAGTTVVTAVYDGHSQSATIHVHALSDNANLGSLTLSRGSLSPAFDPDTTSYSVRVPHTVRELTVTADTASAEATVSIAGADAAAQTQSAVLTLRSGRNEAAIIVTAEDGTSRTYQLTLWRERAHDPGDDQDEDEHEDDHEEEHETPPSGSDFPIYVNDVRQENIGRVHTDTADNGQTRITITLDTAAMNDKLDREGSSTTVTLPITERYGQIIAKVDGQIVSKMSLLDTTLRIEVDTVVYTLPIQLLNLEQVKRQLGLETQDDAFNLQIDLTHLTEEASMQLEEQAAEDGADLLVRPMSFAIVASTADRRIELDRFSAYVTRSFILADEESDPQAITTGVVWMPDGTFRHVPTKITRQADGKLHAEIHSMTNSTYAVVYHPASFADVQGHWSEAVVNDMASRLVVNGVDEARFNPDAAVTRAEFAAMVNRGLGLYTYEAPAAFSDGGSHTWYDEVVSVSNDYGLVSGFADRTFRPGASITRQEAMVIMANALALADRSIALSEAQARQLLGGFTDADQVSTWARMAAAEAIHHQIVIGSGQQLHPTASLTRAEAAAMILRMLQAAELI